MTFHRFSLIALLHSGLLLTMLAACAPTQPSPSWLVPPPSTTARPATPPPAVGIGYVNLQSLPQTIGLEHQDRVNRFNRLAQLNGIAPPRIDQLQVPPGMLPGLTYPVPVVRVTFDEKVFFDFNKDILRPEAEPVLDVIAQNMRRDVPDASLLVLGHTDAIGSDAYNIDLSRRRAQTVLEGLIRRGVDPRQLSTVAIGKNQPTAPNSTEEGRARNRRVEFMISASAPANLRLVQQRRINKDFLAVKPEMAAEPQVPKQVRVFSPADLGIAPATTKDAPEAAKPAAPVAAAAPEMIALQVPSTPPAFELNRPRAVEQADLNSEFQM
ncbi:OmpA family protein [Nitrospirillum viridazoti]|nr:OmpA family protein [Nitrospirillum amazonense]